MVYGLADTQVPNRANRAVPLFGRHTGFWGFIEIRLKTIENALLVKTRKLAL